MDAAIKMGTLTHDKELTVAISSTGYLNCDPRTQHCFKGGKPDGTYKGFAVYSGYCFSTCILVWVGGKERLSGGAMGVASDHPATFNKKKPEKEIIAEIEEYLAKTMGNFVVLELMKKATESAPYPYSFTPEILQEASIVTSDDWADVLVDRKLCLGASPAKNCVLAK